ncbi:MAG TPA: hypothetical protein DHU93_16025, partial [Algoriphagus sp.]|nr:hypothetical protein [Algoriphagus sp.]
MFSFSPFFGKNFSFFLIILLLSFPLFAQENTGKIKGNVIDQSTRKALPFATIAIYSEKDSLIGGGITSDNGKFSIELPNGKFYALV